MEYKYIKQRIFFGVEEILRFEIFMGYMGELW